MRFVVLGPRDDALGGYPIRRSVTASSLAVALVQAALVEDNAGLCVCKVDAGLIHDGKLFVSDAAVLTARDGVAAGDIAIRHIVGAQLWGSPGQPAPAPQGDAA